MDYPDRILVLVEVEDGQCSPVSFELLKAGLEMAWGNRDRLCACILGLGVNELAGEIAGYASQVFVMDNLLLSGFQPDLQASVLSNLCLETKPRFLLMAQTYENLEVAPKIAVSLGADLITDCTRIAMDAQTGNALATKPICSDHAQAIFELDTPTQIILLRSGTYQPLTPGLSRGSIIHLDYALDPSRALTEKTAFIPEEIINLGQAEVIVSAGRGIKNPEGIDELKKLVAVLRNFFNRVELGASRPLVDAGLLPRSRQVGQTGESVAPQLYIAVGISGAIQHLTGMTNSGKIVAINTDREAPIFGVADYGVVGPFEEAIPAMIQTLKEIS